MQNKPNIKNAQMNISPFMTIKYEKMDTWLSWKNKPNSNPNKPNSNPISKQLRYPCAGSSIFVLLTEATRPYLLRLRMAIPMHRPSPPYNTKQPNRNIIHADNGILYSPYT